VSAGIWLTVRDVARLYTDGDTETVRNWWRRDRVEHRLTHGVREINAESVEIYLKTRGDNGMRNGVRRAR
jgi:hypothetical protein